MTIDRKVCILVAAMALFCTPGLAVAQNAPSLKTIGAPSFAAAEVVLANRHKRTRCDPSGAEADIAWRRAERDRVRDRPVRAGTRSDDSHCGGLGHGFGQLCQRSPECHGVGIQQGRFIG